MDVFFNSGRGKAGTAGSGHSSTITDSIVKNKKNLVYWFIRLKSISKEINVQSSTGDCKCPDIQNPNRPEIFSNVMYIYAQSVLQVSILFIMVPAYELPITLLHHLEALYKQLIISTPKYRQQH